MNIAVKRLILMRHAKSDWHSGAESDFDRPLNKRGRRAAVEMGEYLKEHGITPDRIVSSPALRARQTVDRMFLQTGWRIDRLRFDDALYLASAEDLRAACHRHGDDVDCLMLVGHNPGLDDLFEYLCGNDLPRTAKGKLMTTANLAFIELGSGGVDKAGAGTMTDLVRPR